MKRLICLIVILSCGVLYAQQRPQATVETYQKHISNCEINADLKEQYIQQLEFDKADQQKQIDDLQRQISDLKPKAENGK